MTEPKKRGRPSKADIAAREAAKQDSPQMNGDQQYWPEPPEAEPKVAALLKPAPDVRAQAYAMRVWSGQSDELKRAERIARCERALQGQNLPAEGVKYPGAEDDEEWSEEDMQPVTWRKAKP